MSRMILVVALVLASVTLVTVSPASGETRGPAWAPELLAGVPGSSTIYVVSTNVKFESNNPTVCGYQACFNMERTSDNGASFTTVRLPRISFVNGSQLGNLSRVVFATTTTGYLILGGGSRATLEVTIDGAMTWHSHVIASDASLLNFAVSHGELYAVVATCTKSGVCSDYRLARSPLSADRWTFSTLAKWPSGMGVGMGAFGADVWLTQQTPSTVVVYISHNQGRTFTRSTAPTLASVYACTLTATSKFTVWAECPTGMAVSFFYSGDGGLHWGTIRVGQFSGTGGGAFDPVSSTVGYLDYGFANSSGSENMYRITHEGRSITAVGTLSCNEVTGLVFTDVTQGLAACDRSYTQATTFLMRTSDGGATWSKIVLP